MGLLDQFKAYVQANTPRATTPRVSPGKVINEGLLNPNQFNAPAANRFKDSLFGMTGIVPGVGDVASGVQAADFWNRGEKLNAGLSALGALPFVPAIGGIVSKNLSKTGDARDAAANMKQILAESNGVMPLHDIAQMNRQEFDTFYDYLAPHHQGKFDRMLRQYAPNYDDLPTTIQMYADDFKYENPRIVSKYKNIKPDDMVDVYRSVSKSDPDMSIMPGDWIALERAYANMHGQLGDEGARLMKMKVPAKDIRWAGTSADEYFYVPSSGVDNTIDSKYQALLKQTGLLSYADEAKKAATKKVPIDSLRLNEGGASIAKAKWAWEPNYVHKNNSPVRVDRATNEVLDGYHRIEQARRNGQNNIDVVYVDLSDEARKALGLLDVPKKK